MNIRIGIVGAGFGVSSHLPALLAHPRFDVVALASPHSAAQIAANRAIPHAFASCAQMLDGVALDAVVVASPPFAHRDDVLACLAAGKHVLCEKPFTLNVAQAEELCAAATDSPAICGVVHEFRWVAERAAIKEMIDNGHLTPLRQIEITHLDGRLSASALRARGWWFERRRGGGIAGALLSHLIDTANWYAGRPPVHVAGLLRTANPNRRDEVGPFTSDVDDGAFALLEYGSGLVARVSVDATTAVRSLTFAAHAEGRTAIASGTDLASMRLFSVDDEETSELGCKPSTYARFAAINDHVPLLMELYDAFLARIDGSRESNALPTFEEALVTQRALCAVGYST